MKRLAQTILKTSKKNAEKNTEFLCRAFFHQPKVPVKLLALKNGK